jgi:hypothetical protein
MFTNPSYIKEHRILLSHSFLNLNWNVSSGTHSSNLNVFGKTLGLWGRIFILNEFVLPISKPRCQLSSPAGGRKLMPGFESLDVGDRVGVELIRTDAE